MKKNLLYFIIILFFIIGKSTEEIINPSVFNLITNNKYLNYYKNKLQISSSNKYEGKSNFRIKKSQGSFYYIEHVNSNLILTANPPELKLIQKSDKNSEWDIIETTNNQYIIQNGINKCYIYFKNNNLKCENIKINDASKFSLLKVFDEPNPSEKDLELIENEPIDVIVKYIDLSDPDLKREGIPQIKKDEDNEELKYCVRSILKNIPWVRKINIILPNKKVRYFKDYDLIKEKIVYIYDKDLIGKDSANIYSFLFNYWRLSQFNVSENIIIMDDDYFIGKPLKKSDFFYVEEGKVIPVIVSTDYIELSQNSIKNNARNRRNKAVKANGKQNSDVFQYSIYHTYEFVSDILNKKTLKIPVFTHNAMPMSLKNIKEIYDLVYNSKYKEPTLDSLFRGIECMQFQTLYSTYLFNKNFNLKVNPIPSAYIDHIYALKYTFDKTLFVFNTGGEEYKPLTFTKLRLAMEQAFPEPTPYEIFNSTDFPSFCVNVVLGLENEVNEANKKLKDIEGKNNGNVKKLEDAIKKDKKEIQKYEEKVKKNEEDIKIYKETIKKNENDLDVYKQTIKNNTEKIEKYKMDIRKYEILNKYNFSNNSFNEIMNKNIELLDEVNDIKQSKNFLHIFCIIESILLSIIIFYILKHILMKQAVENLEIINSENIIKDKKEENTAFKLMNIN